jgi:hypothetical protein
MEEYEFVGFSAFLVLVLMVGGIVGLFIYLIVRAVKEGFTDNTIYQNAIIEEKLDKYSKQCDKPTPVLASYDITADRRDYMEVLENYINGGENMRNKLEEQTFDNTNRITQLEQVGDTTLDKLKRTLDSMDLQDRASHYFFLSKLSGAEQGL